MATPKYLFALMVALMLLIGFNRGAAWAKEPVIETDELLTEITTEPLPAELKGLTEADFPAAESADIAEEGYCRISRYSGYLRQGVNTVQPLRYACGGAIYLTQVNRPTIARLSVGRSVTEWKVVHPGQTVYLGSLRAGTPFYLQLAHLGATPIYVSGTLLY